MLEKGYRHSSVDSSAPAALGSSPKHTIYAFYSQICTVFAIVLRKEQK